MGYVVTRIVGDGSDSLKLTQAKFEALRAAKNNLVIILSIEEKLTLLLENYVDFEQELLSRTLNSIVFRPDSWSAVMAEIHAYNRRVVNLLTTCRLYLDQVQHDLSVIYGSGSTVARDVNATRSEMYDSSLGYRTMEALRNYVQHRGLPVYSITHRATHAPREGKNLVANVMIPYLNVARIKEDGGFKAGVLRELDGLGEKIDIRPLVREYVEGIGKVHTCVRASTYSDVVSWDRLLEGVRSRFAAVFKEPEEQLTLVARSDKGHDPEEVQIFKDLITRRKWLEQRTAHLTHYSRQVVTNEVLVDTTNSTGQDQTTV